MNRLRAGDILSKEEISCLIFPVDDDGGAGGAMQSVRRLGAIASILT